MKIRNRSELVPVPVDMTPMIDMVFQLLIFFMLTFKIIAQEGDFGITMPLAAPREGEVTPDFVPPMRVKLSADAAGKLAGITLNDKPCQGFPDLHAKIRGFIGDERGPGSIQSSAEVELDLDYGLHYENVVMALTAVSGYVNDGGDVIRLVEKIKFTPPKPPAAGQ